MANFFKHGDQSYYERTIPISIQTEECTTPEPTTSCITFGNSEICTETTLDSVCITTTTSTNRIPINNLEIDSELSFFGGMDIVRYNENNQSERIDRCPPQTKSNCDPWYKIADTPIILDMIKMLDQKLDFKGGKGKITSGDYHAFCSSNNADIGKLDNWSSDLNTLDKCSMRMNFHIDVTNTPTGVDDFSYKIIIAKNGSDDGHHAYRVSKDYYQQIKITDSDGDVLPFTFANMSNTINNLVISDICKTDNSDNCAAGDANNCIAHFRGDKESDCYVNQDSVYGSANGENKHIHVVKRHTCSASEDNIVDCTPYNNNDFTRCYVQDTPFSPESMDPYHEPMVTKYIKACIEDPTAEQQSSWRAINPLYVEKRIPQDPILMEQDGVDCCTSTMDENALGIKIEIA